MTKVRLKQNTTDGSKGDIIDVDQTTADIYTREGMAEKVSEESLKQETPDITDEVRKGTEKTGSSEGQGPLMSKKIPVSQQRNLRVVVWPGQENRNPSITLEEGRKDDSGNWQNNRIYLPMAKSCELAERIKEAALFVRDLS